MKSPPIRLPLKPPAVVNPMTDPLSMNQLMHELTVGDMTPDEAARRMPPPTPKNTPRSQLGRSVQRQTEALYRIPPEIADAPRRDLAGDNSWL